MRVEKHQGWVRQHNGIIRELCSLGRIFKFATFEGWQKKMSETKQKKNQKIYPLQLAVLDELFYVTTESAHKKEPRRKNPSSILFYGCIFLMPLGNNSINNWSHHAIKLTTFDENLRHLFTHSVLLPFFPSFEIMWYFA